MNQTLTWRATWPEDPRSHATDGAAMSGDVTVGRVWYDNASNAPGWRYALTIVGAGVSIEDRSRLDTNGGTDTKEEARAAVQTAWLGFLALADPELLHELRARYGPKEERVTRRRG